MNNKNLDKLITEALAIEAEEAKEAGTIGYMARALVQATMPHKRVKGNEFKRSNGVYSLTILSPANIGLPYGTMPRLLLAWLTTEAVKTKSPEIVLGHTLSGFMRELGLIPSGGRWGTIKRLREQTHRLFSSAVSCHYSDNERAAGIGFTIAKAYDLWWQPQQPGQGTLWQSTVTLSNDFFEEIINSPVPIDMRALNTLKRSPLALDIYCWLTYRMSYLRKAALIPWVSLQSQFGAGYALDAQGVRDFKRAFLRELKKVLLCYPANVEEAQEGYGLLLKPSRTHVKRIISQS